METVFISTLKPFLDRLAERMALYAPVLTGGHYSYARYNSGADSQPVFNNIRTCSPAKEFLFPLREIAAVFPEPQSPPEVEPFAVFGLKDCDLRSIQILDHVFDPPASPIEASDKDFKDPSYIERRRKMFIISTDCIDPAKSCCCTLFEGASFPKTGFDLNVSKISDGFIIEAGSEKGSAFIRQNLSLFADVPSAALAERDRIRKQTQEKLETINADYALSAPIKEIVLGCDDYDLFDTEAQNCVECQACTRVCPTCHCFFLYDSQNNDSFEKTKMWDSCVRRGFAAVAGGENPRKILGDRTRHRLLHKFVYFLDRYGIQMCTGCGRCIDACAGKLEIRDILRQLDKQLQKPRQKLGK